MLFRFDSKIPNLTAINREILPLGISDLNQPVPARRQGSKKITVIVSSNFDLLFILFPKENGRLWNGAGELTIGIDDRQGPAHSSSSRHRLD